jgi:phospholipase/lecithinase/hemolysin
VQIATYLDAHSRFEDDQLVVLWGGANDFLNAGQTDPAVPVGNLSAEIMILAAAGARTIVVPNLPLLGRTPRHVGTATQASFNALTIQFNRLLDAELDDLEAALGITILRLDTFSVFQRALNRPRVFGFRNGTGTALMSPNGDVGLGPVVPNPDRYVFWTPSTPRGSPID